MLQLWGGAGDQVDEPSAYAHAIDRLFSACKACMDRLNCLNPTEVESALKTMDQKLASLWEKSTRDVKEAEQALAEAKQMKVNWTRKILELVRKRHEELVADGDSEASASLQSVVDVWEAANVETQALLASRTESEQRVKISAQALQAAKENFHLMKNSCEPRTASVTRATTALEAFIRMLTRWICHYQKPKAKGGLQEEEKTLATHTEHFGDSAPIKKGDIERCICELIDVMQSSLQVIPQSVRLVLIREFKALQPELSGPVGDVVQKFVATIENAAGGVSWQSSIHNMSLLRCLSRRQMPLETWYMEICLEAGCAMAPAGQGTEMEDADHKSGNGGCM
ncbi:hypothetical protein PR001_g26453 [Phytophthora rubi]|uniref:Uncharacterized protein n=1 Tax=Phytophthora rubi TaxID=129364 RepID=A0A6A3HSK1_9STRA|nr:hypothetical protein PR002_g26661 [Phytophthora rubi]KAE8972950.1 hypothetical protein PR001_g26453 [Phytophthora rubi]